MHREDSRIAGTARPPWERDAGDEDAAGRIIYIYIYRERER